MLVWEGATFIGLLLVGGVALLVSIRREQARQRRGRSVLHGVHARPEDRAREPAAAGGEPSARTGPTRRDNPNHRAAAQGHAAARRATRELAVLRAAGRRAACSSRFELAPLIERTALDWPRTDRARRRRRDASLADARALESVLRNLLQNAVVHGGATAVHGRIEQRAGGRVDDHRARRRPRRAG